MDEWITKILQQYIVNLSKEHIKFNLFRGKGVVRHVVLNTDEINSMKWMENLQIRFGHIAIDELSIKASLARLRTKPLLIRINHLNIDAYEHNSLQPTITSTNKEEQTPPRTVRRPYGLKDRIADGVRIEINEVRIRLRTFGKRKIPRAGIWNPPDGIWTLHKVTLFSVDEYGREGKNLEENWQYNEKRKKFYQQQPGGGKVLDYFVFKKLMIESLTFAIQSRSPPCVGGDGKVNRRRSDDPQTIIQQTPVECLFTLRRAFYDVSNLLGVEVDLRFDRMNIHVGKEDGSYTSWLAFLLGLYYWVESRHCHQQQQQQQSQPLVDDSSSIPIEEEGNKPPPPPLVLDSLEELAKGGSGLLDGGAGGPSDSSSPQPAATSSSSLLSVVDSEVYNTEEEEEEEEEEEDSDDGSEDSGFSSSQDLLQALDQPLTQEYLSSQFSSNSEVNIASCKTTTTATSTSLGGKERGGGSNDVQHATSLPKTVHKLPFAFAMTMATGEIRLMDEEEGVGWLLHFENFRMENVRQANANFAVREHVLQFFLGGFDLRQVDAAGKIHLDQPSLLRPLPSSHCYSLETPRSSAEQKFQAHTSSSFYEDVKQSTTTTTSTDMKTSSSSQVPQAAASFPVIEPRGIRDSLFDHYQESQSSEKEEQEETDMLLRHYLSHDVLTLKLHVLSQPPPPAPQRAAILQLQLERMHVFGDVLSWSGLFRFLRSQTDGRCWTGDWGSEVQHYPLQYMPGRGVCSILIKAAGFIISMPPPHHHHQAVSPFVEIRCGRSTLLVDSEQLPQPPSFLDLHPYFEKLMNQKNDYQPSASSSNNNNSMLAPRRCQLFTTFDVNFLSPSSGLLQRQANQVLLLLHPTALTLTLSIDRPSQQQQEQHLGGPTTQHKNNNTYYVPLDSQALLSVSLCLDPLRLHFTPQAWLSTVNLLLNQAQHIASQPHNDSSSGLALFRGARVVSSFKCPQLTIDFASFDQSHGSLASLQVDSLQLVVGIRPSAPSVEVVGCVLQSFIVIAGETSEPLVKICSNVQTHNNNPPGLLLILKKSASLEIRIEKDIEIECFLFRKRVDSFIRSVMHEWLMRPCPHVNLLHPTLIEGNIVTEKWLNVFPVASLGHILVQGLSLMYLRLFQEKKKKKKKASSGSFDSEFNIQTAKCKFSLNMEPCSDGAVNVLPSPTSTMILVMESSSCEIKAQTSEGAWEGYVKDLQAFYIREANANAHAQGDLLCDFNVHIVGQRYGDWKVQVVPRERGQGIDVHMPRELVEVLPAELKKIHSLVATTATRNFEEDHKQQTISYISASANSSPVEQARVNLATKLRGVKLDLNNKIREVKEIANKLEAQLSDIERKHQAQLLQSQNIIHEKNRQCQHLLTLYHSDVAGYLRVGAVSASNFKSGIKAKTLLFLPRLWCVLRGKLLLCYDHAHSLRLEMVLTLTSSSSLQEFYTLDPASSWYYHRLYTLMYQTAVGSHTTRNRNATAVFIVCESETEIPAWKKALTPFSTKIVTARKLTLLPEPSPLPKASPPKKSLFMSFTAPEASFDALDGQKAAAVTTLLNRFKGINLKHHDQKQQQQKRRALSLSHPCPPLHEPHPPLLPALQNIRSTQVQVSITADLPCSYELCTSTDHTSVKKKRTWAEITHFHESYFHSWQHALEQLEQQSAVISGSSGWTEQEAFAYLQELFLGSCQVLHEKKRAMETTSEGTILVDKEWIRLLSEYFSTLTASCPTNSKQCLSMLQTFLGLFDHHPHHHHDECASSTRVMPEEVVQEKNNLTEGEAATAVPSGLSALLLQEFRCKLESLQSSMFQLHYTSSLQASAFDQHCREMTLEKELMQEQIQSLKTALREANDRVLQVEKELIHTSLARDEAVISMMEISADAAKKLILAELRHTTTKPLQQPHRQQHHYHRSFSLPVDTDHGGRSTAAWSQASQLISKQKSTARPADSPPRLHSHEVEEEREGEVVVACGSVGKHTSSPGQESSGVKGRPPPHPQPITSRFAARRRRHRRWSLSYDEAAVSASASTNTEGEKERRIQEEEEAMTTQLHADLRAKDKAIEELNEYLLMTQEELQNRQTELMHLRQTLSSPDSVLLHQPTNDSSSSSSSNNGSTDPIFIPWCRRFEAERARSQALEAQLKASQEQWSQLWHNLRVLDNDDDVVGRKEEDDTATSGATQNATSYEALVALSEKNKGLDT